jgi:molybdopterin-guanine dinucleotide biosynthesis protein A
VPAGLLLTGGSSRRMGFDKAAMLVEGRASAARVAAALSAVARPVLEVGPGRSGLPAVSERPPGSGPLAAIAAGWRALTQRGHGGPVLVLACDLPLVDENVLRLLADWPTTASVVPVVAGRDQPLCARWSAADLGMVEGMVAHGERSLRGLLSRPGVVRLDEGDWGRSLSALAFADVDSPADADALGVRWARPGPDPGQEP